jgi:hypothetical protein
MFNLRQRQRIFPLTCVQTGSGAHPASCPMGNGGPSPGGEARPGRDTDHLPHLLPRSWMSRSYTSSPSLRFRRCVVGLLYHYMFTKAQLPFPVMNLMNLVHSLTLCYVKIQSYIALSSTAEVSHLFLFFLQLFRFQFTFFIYPIQS